MIQRVQSLFLLLVAVVMVAMMFLPLWQKVDVDKKEKLTLTAIQIVHDKQNPTTQKAEIINTYSTYPIAGLGILAAVVAVLSISKYKNRLTQMKLGALNSLILATCLGITVYYIFEAEEMLPADAPAAYLPGFYLTAAAMLLNVLANRFIRRDERLVRSADRIR